MSGVRKGEREEGRAGVCGSQEDLGLLTPGMWEPWRAAGREGDRAWLGSPTLTSRRPYPPA